MVVIGTTLHYAPSGTYYSPWFPRQGNAATFSVELIAQSEAGVTPVGIKVEVETKNQEDKDASATTVTPGTLEQTAIGVGSTRFAGFEELVRFKYTIKNGNSTDDFAHFQMLNPSWETN